MNKSVNYKIEINDKFSKQFKKFNDLASKCNKVIKKLDKSFGKTSSSFGNVADKSNKARSGLRNYIIQSDRAYRATNNLRKKGIDRLSMSLIKMKLLADRGFINLGNATIKAASKIKTIGALAIGGGALFSVKQFADFEEALFGVAKTAGIEVGENLDKMKEKFIDSSKEITASATDLANYGKIGAQLGVKGQDNIIKFAKTIGMLVTSAEGLTGEDASTNLARLLNVTDEHIGKIDRYASSLVALGNNSAATEGEILNFATMLASRNQMFNVTAKQSLGLAASFRSMGLQSELASSGVTRVMDVFNKAISGGADEMRILQSVTGKTQEQLAEQFSKNSIEAVLDFAEGLYAIEKSQKNIAKGKRVDLGNVMEALGIGGIAESTVFTTMGKNIDTIRKSLELANIEYEKNTANVSEYLVQSQTLWSRLKVLYGAIKILAVSIIDPFEKQLKSMIDGLSEFIIKLSEIEGIRPKIDFVMAEIEPFLIKIKDKIVTIFLPVAKSIGQSIAEAFLNSMKMAFKNILPSFDNIKNSFMSGYSYSKDLANSQKEKPAESKPYELKGNINIQTDSGSRVTSSAFTMPRGNIFSTTSEVY
jgi:TP901 family phage tail tape measure protein